MKIEQLLKTALDELRMQMLGTQVLFGFQFESCFQSAFEDISPAARAADAVALGLIVITLASLLAPTSQHRLVERGQATQRILSVTGSFANFANFPFALAIGGDFYVVLSGYMGEAVAIGASVIASLVAFAAWYGSGAVLSRTVAAKEADMEQETDSETSLTSKIDQMLTEARVILPGAQALLGFQFIVTLTRTFEKLPSEVQHIHFIALAALALCVILLLAPAAIHRIAFRGRDVERFHTIGSWLVSIALLPLIVAITGDMYIAMLRTLKDGAAAIAGASVAALVLLSLWYGLPLMLRIRAVH